MIRLMTATLLCLTATTQALRMASLGSSFAAGPGLASHENYGHIAASELGANLTDLSVSGSTLLTMKSQISNVPADANIITITSGGNDLGYVAGLMADSWSSRLSSAISPAINESQLVSRFNENLDMIHGKAPNATIYLVEYPTLLGPDTKPNVNVPFNASRVEHHRSVAATLLSGTRKAAGDKSWVHLVSVADKSIDHGVGSAIAWVNSNTVGRDGGIPWHPNRVGMRATAQLLVNNIRSGTMAKHESSYKKEI